MKKYIILIILATMSFFGYSQDWFGFNRYQADNERIIASGDYPEVVFMGNSITELWAIYHPEFFSSNNYCGRGISGQTSAQMLVRFTADVVNLHPKAVVIMAGTNDVAHNEYWVEPERVVENIVAMCDLALAHDIVPIISSIPPCSEFVWRKEIENVGQTIVEINRVLKTYAEEKGLVYVDYHSALADENLGFPKTLSEDGCHPDPDTYFTMEDLVLKAIREVIK
ncbi:MAG: acylhydrolase [Bacteroidales bacterium]|nr:acylhydrolase [Bacteroidales bacterium]MBR0539165.1 acylhydrolase [Bacteroidales bacterium]